MHLAVQWSEWKHHKGLGYPTTVHFLTYALAEKFTTKKRAPSEDIKETNYKV